MNRRAFCLCALGASFARPDRAAADAAIRLRDLYERDMSFSELAQSLEGEHVVIRGFMAPPLKAEAQFFVLTKRPMATCPFCETSAEWPDDILAVYTKRRLKVVSYNVKLTVSGILQIGPRRDEQTGFLSMIRLEDAIYG